MVYEYELRVLLYVHAQNVSQPHPHDDDNKNVCQSFNEKLRVLQIYVIKCIHAVKQHQNYRIQSTRCILL